jgi:hypothetical protein
MLSISIACRENDIDVLTKLLDSKELVIDFSLCLQVRPHNPIPRLSGLLLALVELFIVV